jgi:uncharacterized protein (TIGR03084 family)
MLPIATDFRAEADTLHALLIPRPASDYARPTQFKRWTIDDILLHLHDSDLAAAASIAGAHAFAAFRAERQALQDRGMSRREAARHSLGGLTGPRLLAAWHARAIALADELGVLPPETRLPWFGPDMGVRMFTTARQMETWAHGQAIYDMLGERRAPTDRLRNIAEIGVRTYGWTFANRGRNVPGPAPHVRLSAPSGGVWTWNDPTPDNRVEGEAEAFCQVVTQTRSIADTALHVAGEPARQWMNLAQCFAGPPESPPPPGTRCMTGRAG